MAEVEIRFEREDRDGLVAVGTYLYDAAKRLGIGFGEECQRQGESDACAVRIEKGGDLLSEPTAAEIEQLSPERRKQGERLACQAKFIKPGEAVIMTKEKAAEEKPDVEEKKEEFKKEFEEMPLEKKIASLLELEAITLGETLSFVLNSPYAVANKVMDVMAEFGQKLETESKKATRPKEHVEKEKNGNKKEEAKKNGAADSKKTSAGKRTGQKKKTGGAKKQTPAGKEKTEASGKTDAEAAGDV